MKLKNKKIKKKINQIRLCIYNFILFHIFRRFKIFINKLEVRIGFKGYINNKLSYNRICKKKYLFLFVEFLF
jgi:hypothetical protein